MVRALGLIGCRLMASTTVAAHGAAGTPVVLGFNVISYAGGDPPTCYGPSLLYDYGKRGVRPLVRDQLAAMHAGGARSLRLFLTFDHDESENPYFVPARTGRLEEPFRSNLVSYLSDVRAAGYSRLTLAFDPRHSVDVTPVWPDNTYVPARFDETWSLIRDVRPLLKRYGPAETRVDLMNEGSPDWAPETEGWLARMYSLYADAFGTDDVTVSTGYWTGITRLVRALRASGRPLPRWFDVHPRWTAAGVLEDLRRFDAELRAEGLSQPLVVGEEKYDDGAVANAVAEFARASPRTIEELMEWPLEHGGEEPANQQARCISPPYTLASYTEALTGSPVSTTLVATVGDSTLAFRTPYGRPVTALAAGTYVVRVTDISARRGFVLDRRRTTSGFRGTTTWKVTLSPSTSHSFGAIGAKPRSIPFAVLRPG